MAVLTVTNILNVARAVCVVAQTDADLSQAERAVCANEIPIIDSVLGDLNPQNIIPNTGRRNAAVTNLRDSNQGLISVDRTHPDFAASRLYNATDAIDVAADLIARQVGDDDLSF